VADTRTELACAACGTRLPRAAKFCPECAHPVAGPPRKAKLPNAAERIVSATAAVEGERKFVTVLFADLKGSMDIVAGRDPEEARSLLDPVLEHMCEAVDQYGGTVSEIMGDGIMALFGAPIAAEDHAVRAARAALTMQDLVRHYSEETQRTHGVPLQIRVGLNSGEVVLRMNEHGLHLSYTAIGLTVHIASRMEEMAAAGAILATADTVRLAAGQVETRPIGPVKVKGLDRPIEAAEVRRAAVVRSRFDSLPARTVTPFVGRQREMQALHDAFTRVESDGAGRIAAIAGDPGIGKSRLVHEFLRSVSGRNVLILEGGTAPYGSGAGYRPGVQIVRQYFGIADADDATAIQGKVAGRIVALSGETGRFVEPILALLRALPADHPFHALPVKERRQQVAESLFWLGRRVAADRPLVLVMEDMQWVTSDTRAFLETLFENVPASTLVIVSYRPDYEAGWLPKAVTELRMEGLDRPVTRALITELLGTDPSLDRLKDALPARSAGNPLFIEEHIRSLLQSGDLQGDPGRYRLVSSLERVEIPPTVRAVLAARIDRLDRVDKHALQALAVVGDLASVGVLAQVLDRPVEDLRKSLRRLQATGLLIERSEGEQLSYEFKHSLTQAVAYETLLRERQRALHLRVMDALADTDDYDVLARHAVEGEAWERAVAYLWAAGKFAAGQFAEVEAVAYFERALELLPRLPTNQRTPAMMIDLNIDLRNALVPLGRHRRIPEVLHACEELAVESGDERRHAQVLSFLSNYYGNVGRSNLALDAAERALQLAEKVAAPRMLLMATLSVGEINRTLGNYRSAADHLRRVVAMSDPAEAQVRHGQVGLPSVRARSHLAWTLAELGSFDQARRVAEEGLQIADASRHAYSVCHACLGLGGTRVRQGEFQAAVSVLARGLAATERVPLLRPPIAADLGLAWARCGDIPKGLMHLHDAVDSAKSMGRLSRLPLLIVKCGETHLVAGEPRDALLLAEDALRLAREQSERGNEVYARHLLGEINAHDRARPVADAETYFHDALRLADELGMRPLAARCHAGLATLYLRAGRRELAQPHAASARAMFREMAMRFWLDKLDCDIAALA
jgi:class 3 adenylate cyclase/tetratricopeptide (TPR) repeat protein